MCKLKFGFKIDEPNGKEWKLGHAIWPHLRTQLPTLHQTHQQTCQPPKSLCLFQSTCHGILLYVINFLKVTSLCQVDQTLWGLHLHHTTSYQPIVAFRHFLRFRPKANKTKSNTCFQCSQLWLLNIGDKAGNTGFTT